MEEFVPSGNCDITLYVGSSLEWNFDKGTVNEHGEVVSTCDYRFLIELLTRFDRGYEEIYHYFVIEEDDDERIERIIQGEIVSPEYHAAMSDEFRQVVFDTALFFTEIASEVRRLQRYQALFPDDASMKGFHIGLLSRLSSNHDKWKGTSGVEYSEPCWTRLDNSEWLIEFWLRRPTYEHDLRPWEQFMKNQAPGSGINPKTKFLNEACVLSPFKDPKQTMSTRFHILPPGGMAVFRDWSDNFSEYLSRIQITDIPQNQQLKTVAGQILEDQEQVCSPRYRSESLPFHIPLNLWSPQVFSTIRVFEEDDLYTIETVIGDLEGFIDLGFEEMVANGVLVVSELPDLSHTIGEDLL